jgi:hypothetical protein
VGRSDELTTMSSQKTERADARRLALSPQRRARGCPGLLPGVPVVLPACGASTHGPARRHSGWCFRATAHAADVASRGLLRPGGTAGGRCGDRALAGRVGGRRGRVASTHARARRSAGIPGRRGYRSPNTSCHSTWAWSPRTVRHDCQVMRRMTSVMARPMSGSAIGRPIATTTAEAMTASDT